MNSSTDNFYLNKIEPNKSCLLALRTIILKKNNKITETTKYGMPCFCYEKKPFCYLWTDKKTDEPYLLLVEGKHLNHPDLEIGTRKKMKILRIDPNKDLPIDSLTQIIKAALNLFTSGAIKS